MSCKGLTDMRKCEALILYLTSTGNLRGVLLAVAVHRDLRSVFSPPLSHASELYDLDRASFGPSLLEKMLLSCHMASALTALLVRSTTRLSWILDEDAITDTPERQAMIGRVFRQLLHAYRRSPPLDAKITSVKHVQPQLAGEDVLALTDLVSGALADLLPAILPSSDGHAPSVLQLLPRLNRAKANYVVSWLHNGDDNIVKVILVLRPGADGSLSVGDLRLATSSPGVLLSPQTHAQIIRGK